MPTEQSCKLRHIVGESLSNSSCSWHLSGSFDGTATTCLTDRPVVSLWRACQYHLLRAQGFSRRRCHELAVHVQRCKIEHPPRVCLCCLLARCWRLFANPLKRDHILRSSQQSTASVAIVQQRLICCCHAPMVLFWFRDRHDTLIIRLWDIRQWHGVSLECAHHLAASRD